MKKLIVLVCMISLLIGGIVNAACPRADISGDCKVNLEDLAIMASEWLSEGSPEVSGMVWISINSPDEGFTGEMSKYETTNAQYCEFLNAALASGDIIVDGTDVNGTSGPYSGQSYYNIAGPGETYDGAINGGAARIGWTNKIPPIGAFHVDSGFENHPVTHVSWYGSMAFCDYYGYRLPTEWQWQSVADYDGSYSYGCGTSINNSIANYYNSIHLNGTTVVGSFGSYGYGMCDMAGNVWEWTDSIDSDNSTHVIRGGCCYSQGSNCSVSYRVNYYTNNTNNSVGFRVCR